MPKAEKIGNTVIIKKEARDEDIKDKIKKTKNKDADVAETLQKILERIEIIERKIGLR